MRFENGTVYYGEPRVGNRANAPKWDPAATKSGIKRYFGQLLFVPNLSEFPFDSQTLEFSISHPTLNASKLVWQPLVNESYISDLLRLINWRYSNSSLSIITQNEQYAPGGANFNQVKLSIFMRRRLAAGIQTLMSPSFALVMVFVSFWLPVKDSISRISMATAALVSEVFIHVSLRNSSLLNLSTSKNKIQARNFHFSFLWPVMLCHAPSALFNCGF